MKNHSLLFALVTIALILGLWAAFQAVRYHFIARQLAVAQAQVNQVQLRLINAQALVSDALEYSRRNPAIDPILQSFKLKANPATNTAPPSAVQLPPK